MKIKEIVELNMVGDKLIINLTEEQALYIKLTITEIKIHTPSALQAFINNDKDLTRSFNSKDSYIRALKGGINSLCRDLLNITVITNIIENYELRKDE